MAISYRHIQGYEKEILELKEQGLTLKEIWVLKIKPCKRNNRQNSDHTKDAVQTWAKTQQAEF